MSDPLDADAESVATIGRGQLVLVDGRTFAISDEGGEMVGREPLETARDRHKAARAELPPQAHQLSKGEPVIDTEHVG